MTSDERGRHRLYDRAVEVLGEEEAHELMAKLPPTPWPDLATKQDLHHEFGLLRGELQHEVTVLRTEMVSMEHRITAAFHKELREAISGQTKAYIAWTGGLMALLATMTTVASR